MTAPLVAVLVIAVGLPLLAWWVAGRPYWSRLRPGAELDAWRDLVRRHGLSAGEAARIAADVPRGLRLPDPRLRRAAVDWARELLGQEQVRLPRNPRTRGLVVVVVIGWAAEQSEGCRSARSGGTLRRGPVEQGSPHHE